MDDFLESPTVTITEARKYLGSKYSHLSDNQVQDIIIHLTLLARNAMNNKVPNNH